MSSSQVDEQITMPEEVFQSCKKSQARMTDIEEKTLVLIENTLAGNTSSLEASFAQINPSKKNDFDLMAQVIVAKALEDVPHCKACVRLAGALHVLFPALPSAHRHRTESFLHALLDAFQTEFECLFLETGSVLQKNRVRIRAIVQFAGHLYCHGLLGNGVVSQMVQDLSHSGEGEFARELLWFTGVISKTNSEYGSLGTVIEDPCDSDGASAESISTSRRRPSCP